MFNTYYERCNSRDRGRGGAVGDVDMQHASKAQQRAKEYMASKCRKSGISLRRWLAVLLCLKSVEKGLERGVRDDESNSRRQSGDFRIALEPGGKVLAQRGGRP